MSNLCLAVVKMLDVFRPRKKIVKHTCVHKYVDSLLSQLPTIPANCPNFIRIIKKKGKNIRMSQFLKFHMRAKYCCHWLLHLGCPDFGVSKVGRYDLRFYLSIFFFFRKKMVEKIKKKKKKKRTPKNINDNKDNSHILHCSFSNFIFCQMHVRQNFFPSLLISQSPVCMPLWKYFHIICSFYELSSQLNIQNQYRWWSCNYWPV